MAGFWQSCSGCCESVEGYVNPDHYPTHPKHRVATGSGCDECKGKGVVYIRWTRADEEHWAREFDQSNERLADQINSGS